jgi:hypothetical protein
MAQNEPCNIVLELVRLVMLLRNEKQADSKNLKHNTRKEYSFWF